MKCFANFAEVVDDWDTEILFCWCTLFQVFVFDNKFPKIPVFLTRFEVQLFDYSMWFSLNTILMYLSEFWQNICVGSKTEVQNNSTTRQPRHRPFDPAGRRPKYSNKRARSTGTKRYVRKYVNLSLPIQSLAMHLSGANNDWQRTVSSPRLGFASPCALESTFRDRAHSNNWHRTMYCVARAADVFSSFVQQRWGDDPK